LYNLSFKYALLKNICFAPQFLGGMASRIRVAMSWKAIFALPGKTMLTLGEHAIQNVSNRAFQINTLISVIAVCGFDDKTYITFSNNPCQYCDPKPMQHA
jgi:hypothetical protein